MKTIGLPGLFSGGSLETAGNGSPRQMIIQDITRLIVQLINKKPGKNSQSGCVCRVFHREAATMDGKKKTALCLAAAVLLVLCFFILGVKNGEKERASAYVTVKTPYFTGRGVVYGRDGKGGYLVTAGHVLSGLACGDLCTVVFSDGSETEAEVFYLSETADAAFLKVEEKNMPETAAPVKTDRKRFDGLREGDVLHTLSGDGTERIEGVVVSTWIYVEDFSLDMMLLKMNVTGGMSGSAVVDADGYFAGIICGVSREGEAAVLPFSVIESEWMQAKERDDKR